MLAIKKEKNCNTHAVITTGGIHPANDLGSVWFFTCKRIKVKQNLTNLKY